MISASFRLMLPVTETEKIQLEGLDDIVARLGWCPSRTRQRV